MPRVQGEQSNYAAMALWVVVALIIVLGYLEYTGAINLLPGVGGR